MSSTHPFFVRLFKETRRWSKAPSDNRPSNQSSTRTRDPDSIAEQLFYDAAQALADELRVPSLRDLGVLFDTVVNTHTITKPKRFTFKCHRRSQSSGKSQGTVVATPATVSAPDDSRNTKQAQEYQSSNHRRTRSASHVTFSAFESSSQLESGGVARNKDRSSKMRLNELYREVTALPSFQSTSAANGRISNESISSETEDSHIFLVKRVDRKEIGRLLALGYRFADTVYISKTMGQYLQIPSDHMQCYFGNMRQMADSLHMFFKPSYQPEQQQQASTADCASSMSSRSKLSHEEYSKSVVYVGLAILVQEPKQELDADKVHVVVDKARRFTFPMTKILYEDGSCPTRLSDKEKLCLSGLHGQTLQSLLGLAPEQLRLLEASAVGTSKDDAKTLVGSPKGSAPIIATADDATSPTVAPRSSESSMIARARFLTALQPAAERLLRLSSFGKPLAANAKLDGEVIDIPPFALSPGPCQLILFRTWVNLEGIVSAINQSFSEPIKCLSLPLYRSIAFHVTDQAVHYYKRHLASRVPESMYLAQQRVYQSTAISSVAAAGSSKNNEQISSPISSTSSSSSAPSTPASPASSKYPPINNLLSTMVPSLPPPPRPKRHPRLANLAHIDTPVSETASVASLPVKEVFVDLPVMINILPTEDRFWWLNNVIEQALHDN